MGGFPGEHSDTDDIYVFSFAGPEMYSLRGRFHLMRLLSIYFSPFSCARKDDLSLLMFRWYPSPGCSRRCYGREFYESVSILTC